MEGVGLLEQQRFDDALLWFNDVLRLAKTNADIRFPLMAYMGKAQTLEAQGNRRDSRALLVEALKHLEQAKMQVCKADLSLALAGQAIKRKRVEEAKNCWRKRQMLRPYAEANLRTTELYMAAGDFRRAETAVMKCITASRQLVDMYFLPRHLALAAKIEEHLNKFHRADEYYDEAEQLIESTLLNVPSAAVKASLIATMDDVFRGHFGLALERGHRVRRHSESSNSFVAGLLQIIYGLAPSPTMRRMRKAVLRTNA